MRGTSRSWLIGGFSRRILLKCNKRKNSAMNITKSLLTLGFTVTVAVLSMNASASTAPGVKERQENQAARINQGVASGELTQREAAVLRTEQRAIRAEKRAFKADGKLTKAERAHLHREQNQASRHIHAKKHNAKKPG
jgi:Flp pilus assembly protein TadB